MRYTNHEISVYLFSTSEPNMTSSCLRVERVIRYTMLGYL